VSTNTVVIYETKRLDAEGRLPLGTIKALLAEGWIPSGGYSIADDDGRRLERYLFRRPRKDFDHA